MIDRNHHENEERKRNQDKLIKEEMLPSSAPIPKIYANLIGIEKIVIDKDLEHEFPGSYD